MLVESVIGAIGEMKYNISRWVKWTQTSRLCVQLQLVLGSLSLLTIWRRHKLPYTPFNIWLGGYLFYWTVVRGTVTHHPLFKLALPSGNFYYKKPVTINRCSLAPNWAAFDNDVAFNQFGVKPNGPTIQFEFHQSKLLHHKCSVRIFFVKICAK